jgi:hypothetical protein
MDFIAWVKGVVLPSSNTHTSLLVSSNESNIKNLALNNSVAISEEFDASLLELRTIGKSFSLRCS